MKEGIVKGKAEGIKEGIVKGKAEGIKEGEKKLLFKLLNHRFGELSRENEALLGNLNEEQLEQLGKDLLDFKSRDELTNWLNQATLT
jgi:flagellar biosynthesis/type III secretory pathway protein FliH